MFCFKLSGVNHKLRVTHLQEGNTCTPLIAAQLSNYTDKIPDVKRKISAM